jgi:hypothetical protein
MIYQDEQKIAVELKESLARKRRSHKKHILEQMPQLRRVKAPFEPTRKKIQFVFQSLIDVVTAESFAPTNNLFPLSLTEHAFAIDNPIHSYHHIDRNRMLQLPPLASPESWISSTEYSSEMARHKSHLSSFHTDPEATEA